MVQAATINKEGIFSNIWGDRFFILFIPIIAILTGVTVTMYPQYFWVILMADVWLLGYHHVISTFTRIGFDKSSVVENWKLLFPLPLGIVLAIYLTYTFGGGIFIGTIYLYWQWYHYTRQSEGISKSYGMKAGSKSFVNNFYHRMSFYVASATSFLYMISAGHKKFLGFDIWTIQLAEEIRFAFLMLFSLATMYWLVGGIRSLVKGEISKLYFYYMLSHFAIYIVAYILISDINYGWLTINSWHNAQYIGFVWLFNRKKYAGEPVSKQSIIAYLSQPGRLLMYLLCCLVISTIIYGSLDVILSYIKSGAELPFLLVYSTINFHHYVVDSKIWKLRKPKVYQNIVTAK